jgi:type II secretory pathway component GspD/PulD (secretin)
VTIPDGFTVIVGGLNRKRLARDIKGVPFLERIPVLRNLASSQTNSSSEGMIFVFLRPTIMRDDQFRDLIYLSSEDLPKAELGGDFPCSKPQLIK